MPASISPKRNRLDRKSLKIVLNIVIWIIKLNSSQLMPSDWLAGGEGFNFLRANHWDFDHAPVSILETKN